MKGHLVKAKRPKVQSVEKLKFQLLLIYFYHTRESPPYRAVLSSSSRELRKNDHEAFDWHMRALWEENRFRRGANEALIVGWCFIHTDVLRWLNYIEFKQHIKVRKGKYFREEFKGKKMYTPV